MHHGTRIDVDLLLRSESPFLCGPKGGLTERPKSQILRMLFSPTSKFSCFKSRWMIRCSERCSLQRGGVSACYDGVASRTHQFIPSAAPLAILMRVGMLSGIRWSFRRFAKFPRGRSSVTSMGTPLLLHSPINRTTLGCGCCLKEGRMSAD